MDYGYPECGLKVRVGRDAIPGGHVPLPLPLLPQLGGPWTEEVPPLGPLKCRTQDRGLS